MARITDFESMTKEQINPSADLLHIVDVSSETSIDKKVTVEELSKAVATDTVASGNMQSVTSNAVFNVLPKSETGSITIPSQTLNNGENAEVTIPLIPNKFYCGRIDFSNLPSVNMNISYNDFSGLFQDARSTESRVQAVLYPIGKASLATLHIYLTNYTGLPVTIENVIVYYCLEHHTMI